MTSGAVWAGNAKAVLAMAAGPRSLDLVNFMDFLGFWALVRGPCGCAFTDARWILQGPLRAGDGGGVDRENVEFWLKRFESWACAEPSCAVETASWNVSKGLYREALLHPHSATSGKASQIAVLFSLFFQFCNFHFCSFQKLVSKIIGFARSIDPIVTKPQPQYSKIAHFLIASNPPLRAARAAANAKRCTLRPGRRPHQWRLCWHGAEKSGTMSSTRRRLIGQGTSLLENDEEEAPQNNSQNNLQNN